MLSVLDPFLFRLGFFYLKIMIIIEISNRKIEVMDLAQRWHWANANLGFVEEFTIHPMSWPEEAQHNYHKKYDRLNVPRCRYIG
jgi:hypothetical protein